MATMNQTGYEATTVRGSVQRFADDRMQDAKRFAVQNGNGGTVRDLENGTIWKVTRRPGQPCSDFFNLREIK